MIKVIKHGNMRHCICHRCGCVFSFEKEDVEHIQSCTNDFRTVVECPDCKERNVVSI